MLKEQVQTATLVIKGEHIATLNNGATKYMLFALEGIFVEYEVEQWTNKIVSRSIFCSGTQLDKYVKITARSI
tara:strand:- start:1880 stop:2098 length:219 start_codon:yes stop_codon:yes gene_type:complete